MLAYDITNRRSFQYLEVLASLLTSHADKDVNSIIVATMVDKKAQRKGESCSLFTWPSMVYYGSLKHT